MIRKANPLVLLGFGLCLASPTHAQQADLGSPDLVLINGKVLTMDDQSSVVEAVAVLDGKILATGSNASVKSIIRHTDTCARPGRQDCRSRIDRYSRAFQGRRSFATTS